MKVNRRKEITKIKAEIREIKRMKKLSKTKSWYFFFLNDKQGKSGVFVVYGVAKNQT